ncbi:MAG: DALR domain-containing protein, partial [Methyloligellaceae bacterium]
CSAHGTDVMANVWMHNGFLQVEGEKMSKSLGNFVTINALLEDWPGEVIRLAMLMTHYRQPIDWTAKGVAEARRTLDNWVQLTDGVKASAPDADFLEALCDDVNTPKAISILHELRREAASGNGEAARILKGSAQFMGLLEVSAADWASWRPAGADVDEKEIAAKIALRAAAKAEKDFATADGIRDELAAKGIVLKDNPDGTTWELAR